MTSKLTLSILVFLLIPQLVLANITISEIMYDLEGSDTDREWIEISNGGSGAVDISGYKLFEGSTNHGLTLTEGDANLSAGGFAIIVDDPAKFLIDHPNFTGTIFDSSFSLSNTGEVLILKNTALEEVHSVTYTSEWGAAGDGNSLQFSGGAWLSGSPTPGASNITTASTLPAGNTATSSSSTSTSDTNTTPASTGMPAKPQQIFPYAGEDVVTIAGASTIFEGNAVGFKKEPLLNARYLWNFGDGSSREGKVVSHLYHFPGEYLVTLDVAAGEYSNSDIVKILVIPPTISIKEFVKGEKGFTELSNESEYDLDISFWQITQDSLSFIFPEHTKLLRKKSVRFPNQTTRLLLESAVELKFPNGESVNGSKNTVTQNEPTPVLANTVGAPLFSKVEEKLAIQKAAPKAATAITEDRSDNDEEEQLAAIGNISSGEADSKTNPFVWGSLAALLTILGAGGVLFWRRHSRQPETIQGFDIIEG